MKPKYIFLRVLIIASTIMGVVACSEPTKDEESTSPFVDMLKSAIDVPTNTQKERKAKQQEIQSLLSKIKGTNPKYKHKPTTKDELTLFIQAEIWGQGKNGDQLWHADLNNIDTSLIIDMRFLFGNLSEGKKTYGYKLHSFNGDIGGWNVSSVADMTGMFINAASFNKDISDWNVSSVTNMSAMFSGAKAFNGDIGDWKVSSVTNMKFMFSGAEAFNGDIGDWDVSSVTNMRNMFKSAYVFNQNLDKWNVENLENAKKMFHEATSFNGNVKTWKLKKIEDMNEMFKSARAFNQDLNDWDKHLKNADGIYRKIIITDMFTDSTLAKKLPIWFRKIPQ